MREGGREGTCVCCVLQVEPFLTHITMGDGYGLVQVMRSKLNATERGSYWMGGTGEGRRRRRGRAGREEGGSEGKRNEGSGRREEGRGRGRKGEGRREEGRGGREGKEGGMREKKRVMEGGEFSIAQREDMCK